MTTDDASRTAPSAPAHPRRLPTRILLACAAIGAAGGLVVAPITVFSSTGPALAMPILYAVLAVVKLFPAVLAQTLLRRPGVALLTGVIVGLVNIPFSAHGPMVFVSLAGIALLQELVAAALLYRRWGPAVLIPGNVLVGLVIAWLGWRLFTADGLHVSIAIGYWAAAIVGAIVVTVIALALGARVRRSGVAGLGDARSLATGDEDDEADGDDAADEPSERHGPTTQPGA